MSKIMRAKLTVTSISAYSESITLYLNSQYNLNDKPEDNSFSKNTPSDSATLSITNSDFTMGDKLYADFSKV